MSARLPLLPGNDSVTTDAVDRGIPSLQRRQTAAAVPLEVPRRADARRRLVEQPERCREHALAVESVAAQGGRHAPARARQRLGERERARELAAVAARAPLRVVQVLAPTGLVDADGLDVAVRLDRDPDVLPGGRDDEVVDALAIGLADAATPCASR